MFGGGSWLGQFVVLPHVPSLSFCHRTTVLRLFLVLDLLQIFTVLNVYMSPTEYSPLSVIMALAEDKLEDADAKQTDCILEIRTGYGRKNY
jgi:hypothetical protein